MNNAILTEEFHDCAPIFVVGAPRSGTTLLQRMLDAHPGIALMDEVTFFDGVLKVAGVVPDLGSAEAVDRLFALLPKTQQFGYWNGMEDILGEVRSRLRKDPGASYPKFYLEIMRAYARRQDARRFGDKTPENIRHLETLARIFPNAVFLHVVRDPRANVASRLRLPWGGDDVLSTTLKWRLDVSAARRFRAGDPRSEQSLLDVRYEDLVTDQQRTLRRVCDFIGEDFDPRMLDYHRSKEVLFRDEPWKDGSFQPVYTQALDKWREELNLSQVFLVQAIAGIAMRMNGYRPADVPRGAGFRAIPQFARELGRWLAFKRRVHREHRNQRDIIFFPDNTILKRMMLKGIARSGGEFLNRCRSRMRREAKAPVDRHGDRNG